MMRVDMHSQEINSVQSVEGVDTRVPVMKSEVM